MNKKTLEKIREKREFSQLPEKDIEMAYEHFEKRQVSEEEKINLTKKLLREIFSAFISKKLLTGFKASKDEEWVLRKHISTRERLPYYEKIYDRIFGEMREASVIDLGSGINGFSYKFFKRKIRYVAIESVGQLAELMNFYFKKNKIDARAIHASLFEKEKIKQIIKRQKKPRVVFLFKVIDSLEMLERDYSKELISEIVPITDKIVVSFATKSLGKREKFHAKRNWIVNFIKSNFKMLDDFELNGERYIIFKE